VSAIVKPQTLHLGVDSSRPAPETDPGVGGDTRGLLIRHIVDAAVAIVTVDPGMWEMMTSLALMMGKWSGRCTRRQLY
jgi:hypothetical protein